MASLLNFPVEVLNLILEAVDPNDKPAFFKLSLVCKVFNMLATPMMYRTVEIYEPEDIHKFLFSIISSHARASMVKSFAAIGDKYGAPEVIDIYASRGWLLENSWNRTVIPIWEKHFPKHLPDYFGSYSLLAAVYLTNLDTLSLNQFYGVKYWDFLEAISFASLINTNGEFRPYIWPMLSTVIMGSSIDDNPVSSMMLFARIPTLRRLLYYDISYFGYHSVFENLPFTPIRSRSTDLEELVLESFDILHHARMDRLLRAPKALRVFRYSASGHWYISFKTTWLATSLRHQSHALEEISLTDFDAFLPDMEMPEIEIDFISFSSFRILRTLEVSTVFAFGQAALLFDAHLLNPEDLHLFLADSSLDPLNGDIDLAADHESTERCLVKMLPPSIETLRLRDCGKPWAAERLDRALAELLKWRDIKFPNLNTIELWGAPHRMDQNWISQIHQSALEARVKGMHIRFHILERIPGWVWVKDIFSRSL
ncbi:hypothetical protein F4819DRAFT_381365 [Hypoxylon fuscum]|nr:hypothetical protein F4819DRAFT_381365 [Hypoxylon fuscum]